MSGPPNATETVFVAAPITGARGNVIASPFQFLMTGEDQLVVTGWSDDATIALAVHGRFLKDTGEIQPFVNVCPTAAAVAGQATAINLGKGFLLNLALTVTGSTAIPWGRAYGRVDVVRGTVGPRVILGSLLGGYVTSGPLLAWPGSPIINPWEGEGFLEWRTIANGVAGSKPQVTAGTVVRWQIVAARTTFAPTAGGDTRKPFLAVRLAGFDFLRVPANAFTRDGATLTLQWTTGLGGAEPVFTQQALAALPDPFWVLPGHTLLFDHVGSSGSDLYTDTRYLTRQFLSLP